MSTTRNIQLVHLHPMFREKVLKLINLFEEQDLPFRMFEGFRSPQRQDYLYQQGRSRSGSIITNARPWTSFHQYGLAADFVLFINNKWSWDTSSKINQDRWTKLHELGRSIGLEPLSWEMPHLQIPNLSTKKLLNGEFPSPPDSPFLNNFEFEVVNWQGVTSPKLPDSFTDRPPMQITRRILRINDRGPDVAELQNLLNLKFNSDLLPDGIFGRITETTLKDFQSKNNLTPDGVADPKTFEFLVK